MGRLIDEDAVYEYLTDKFNEFNISIENEFAGKILDCLDEIPTAFDVDKVVAELEFRKSYLNHNGLVVSVPVVTFENAVEIVKECGKDEMF